MTEPPPLPPKKLLIKRHKFIWRLLVNANLALGAYIFVMTSKKDTGMDNSEAAEKSRGNGKAAVEVPSDTNTTTPIPETQDIPLPIPEKKNQTEESSREETY